jgi:putative membrane protein
MLVNMLFWVLIIVGIIYLIARLTRRPYERGEREETPLEILKRRYAKGEIDAEEFAKRKKDLES